MGGNALKLNGESFTRRIDSKVEFLLIWKEVEEKLTRILGDSVKVSLIPFYYNKESFGDMDVLISSGALPPDWTKRVKDEFQPKATFKNGNCFSFDYKDLQIDLITSPEEEYDFTLRYFSFNDLGNFIGRTAHRLGFKFGHGGLWYVLRDEDNDTQVIKEILVTRNFRSAIWFLDFPDYETRKHGFYNPEDIFEYAMSSAFFDPRQFLLVTRSYAGRVRDKKRSMYNGILAYIREKFPDLNEDEEPLKIDKEYHLTRACDVFPKFKIELDAERNRHKEQKAFKKNFNGDIIGSRYGVEGKELGELMARMRKLIDYLCLKNVFIHEHTTPAGQEFLFACLDLIYDTLQQENR